MDDVACSCSRCNADRRVPDDVRVLDLAAARELARPARPKTTPPRTR